MTNDLCCAKDCLCLVCYPPVNAKELNGPHLEKITRWLTTLDTPNNECEIHCNRGLCDLQSTRTSPSTQTPFSRRQRLGITGRLYQKRRTAARCFATRA